jgi:hypothetical protein
MNVLKFKLFVAAVGIVLVSFFAALTIFNYFDIPKLGGRTGSSNNITIIEASYGLSCVGQPVLPGYKNTVRRGNVTDVIAALCVAKNYTCSFILGEGNLIARIGDPAPGCGKNLEIKWKCGEMRSINSISVPSQGLENKSAVNISCPQK